MVNTPENLIFTHTIDRDSPLSVAECVSALRQFKPTLNAPILVTVDDSQFMIRYGGREQIIIWAIGTVDRLGKGTHIQAQIGIARNRTTARLLAGISSLVALMVLAEALSQEIPWGESAQVITLFLAGFVIILMGGMTYSQHRLRRDLIKVLHVN